MHDTEGHTEKQEKKGLYIVLIFAMEIKQYIEYL